MKMSKRIFIVLLTFAVLLSSFALFASADEAVNEEETVEIKNYDYVLEYFEEPVIFGYDFNGTDYDYNDALIMSHPNRVNHSVVSDENAPGGKYLNIEITDAEPWGEENLYLNWNSDEGVDSFYFDATVSADCLNADGYYYPKYRLLLGNECFTDISKGDTVGTSVLTLDFSFGQLSYLGVDEEGNPVEILTDYALVVGAWYNVSLDYNIEEGVCSVTVSNVNDSADSITVSDLYLPYELVKNVRFGVHAVDNTGEYRDANGNVLKIAYLSAAAGTERRNTADLQKGVEDSILEIYGVYTSEDIAIEDKLGLCDVVNSIVSYGFVSEDPDVNAAIADIKYGSVTLYSNELAESLDRFKTLDNYYDKRACIDYTLPYADILTDMDLSPVGEEDAKRIEENIAAAYAEDENLKQIEKDALEYIELMSAVEDTKTDDYTLLVSYCDSVAHLSPDFTYDGVVDAYARYLEILDSMEAIYIDAEYFISRVETLSDTTRDFMVRYAEYLSLSTQIYENETYPGVTEALAKYNDVVLPDILYNISLAENFVKYVERADFASYISAKEENLKIAEQYMNVCHPDFEGVAEAKALRLEIVEFIDIQKANAQAYIDAVNALDNLKGNELNAGITKAENLQKTGNVLGVDGVTEANVKLNQITSELKLRTKYSEHFISLVEKLEFIYEAEELYYAIVEAKAAEVLADQTYTGVADASLDLEFAIEDYNAAVSAVNEEFITANLAASNTAGIGESANSVADNVIAIVQTLFEKEDDEDEEEKSE